MTLQAIADPVRQKVVGLLGTYFSDGEIKNICISAGKTQWIMQYPCIVEGWLPIGYLMTLKRIKAVTKDPAVLVSVIRDYCTAVLELSPDSSCVRRKKSFNPLEFVSVVVQSLTKSVIVATGFPRATSLPSIKTFFDSFATVTNIERHHPSHNTDTSSDASLPSSSNTVCSPSCRLLSQDTISVLVEFAQYDRMIDLLAKQPLLFEEATISIAPHSRPEHWNSRNLHVINNTDMDISTNNHSSSAAITSNISYPTNRLISITLPTAETLPPTSSISPEDIPPVPVLVQTLSTRLREFAPIHSTSISSHNLIVRFKKPVAKDVVNMIQRIDGDKGLRIVASSDTPVEEGGLVANVRALDGVEEKVYWDISLKKSVGSSEQHHVIGSEGVKSVPSKKKSQIQRRREQERKKKLQRRLIGKSNQDQSQVQFEKQVQAEKDESTFVSTSRKRRRNNEEEQESKKIKTGEDLADILGAWAV